MRNHVIISGTGRCGTRSLIELLTRLGLDTGFTVKDIEATGAYKGKRKEYRTLEYSTYRLSPNAPYIIKSPHFCVTISRCLKRYRINVDHLFVPIRNIKQAAHSARKAFKNKRHLIGTCSFKPGVQEAVLRRRLYGLILNASAEMIPVTFMQFPLLTRDSEYLYKKLKPILKDITYEAFADVFAVSMDQSKVHKYPIKQVPKQKPEGKSDV